jgi:hypothetical protein
VKRLEQTPQVKQAAKEGKAVVACVYEGWVPPEIAAQLPAGFRAESWAVEIVDGRVTRLLEGAPEKIVPALISGAAR